MLAHCDDVESCKEGGVVQDGFMLGSGHFLQRTLPCKVALLVVLLKSVMMADVVATQVGAEVCPKVVVAAKCKRTGGPVRGVCGKGPILYHWSGLLTNGVLR